MSQDNQSEPLFLLVISLLIVLSMFTKWGAHRYLKLPPAVGYLLLGVLLRFAGAAATAL